jgi:hypothetical protein
LSSPEPWRIILSGCADGLLARLDDFGDAIRGRGGILMLPYADDEPAEPCQVIVVTTVALTVPLDLRRPVLRVRLGEDSVTRAAVPEAAVNEDCDAGAQEDDVDPRGASTRSDPEVDAEPKTPEM